jgi:hypothetical protein
MYKKLIVLWFAVLNCDAQRRIIESNPLLVVIVVGSHGNQNVREGGE